MLNINKIVSVLNFATMGGKSHTNKLFCHVTCQGNDVSGNRKANSNYIKVIGNKLFPHHNDPINVIIGIRRSWHPSSREACSL